MHQMKRIERGLYQEEGGGRRERPGKFYKRVQAEDIGDVTDGEELYDSIGRRKLYHLWYNYLIY